MSWEAWVTLAVVFGTITVLATDRFAPSLTLLTAVVVLLVADVVSPEQAFSGFSNPAPITVAALYVLAGAVEKTGALQPLVGLLLNGRRGMRALLGRLLLPVAGASAFLNNTPIVAMLTPQVSGWAERNRLSPAHFLMPLSFASILGGMVTLIGTSTNIVVSGLLQASGHPPLGMFELTPVALPVALVGIGLILVLAPRLLADRTPPHRLAEEQLREFVVNMRVVPGGPLDGYTVEGAGLRQLQGMFLVQIERERDLIAPVRPDTVLRSGDRLTFVGRADQVVDLQHVRGLVSTEQDHILDFSAPELRFFEAVIGEASPLVGATVKESNFRGRYQAAVVAIHRSGARVNEKLGQVRLRVGDTLLLLADADFRERWRDRNDFLLVARLGGAPPTTSRKALIVAAVGLGIVVSAASGLLPTLNAALLGAIVLLVSGVLTPREARAAIDLDVIIVIAAAFGLGAALQTSGLATALADRLIGAFGWLGPTGALLGVVLATLILTELVTNNAAAVLTFPVGVAVALAVGVDPRWFAIAIALCASASFLTPIGYQTNTIVYGPGGYRFTDYARLGLPLNLLVMTLVVLIISLAWS